jgi:hypothetical protein
MKEMLDDRGKIMVGKIFSNWRSEYLVLVTPSTRAFSVLGTYKS